MNGFSSECSSGCESGWTLYLEQSFVPNASRKGNGDVARKNGFCFEQEVRNAEEEDEEEDLSMISDASSGPPHFQEAEPYLECDNGFCHPPPKAPPMAESKGKKQKIKEHRRLDSSSFLDDTASSSVFNFSVNNFTRENSQAPMQSFLDLSSGFPAAQFEGPLQGRSAFQDHFNRLQSSLSGNQQQNNQWFKGKGMRLR